MFRFACRYIEIEYEAFKSCSNLEYIEIPEGVEKIGAGSFKFCSKLSGVKLPTNLSNISYWTFEKCISLININIPDSVSVIDDYVFTGCANLKSIIIPAEVDSIKRSSFAGCTSLSQIVMLPSTPPYAMYYDGEYYDEYSSFSHSTFETAVLRVPHDSEQKYRSTFPWFHFKKVSAK